MLAIYFTIKLTSRAPQAPCKRTQHCWPTTPIIVGCYMRKVGNRSNFSANNSQYFFCSVIAEAYGSNVGSACTALPTLLGPRTLVTHGLQRLMGCILPTMHCRSQHCWELLHPFAHHCQHAHNNSQHCWCNNVRSRCVHLHAVSDLCVSAHPSY